MAIKITYNDPRRNQAELPDGVALVKVASDFKDHYRVYAQNGDYPTRTDLGTIKRHAEGHFIIEVEWLKWLDSGMGLTEKSHGALHIKDANEAVIHLYVHRLGLKQKGVINE